MTVVGSRPYWREIRFNGNTPGWIAKKFIVPAATPTPQPVPTPLPNDMWLTVHFIDVGQGDAIWINTPDDEIDGNGIFEGMNIVIDGGRYSSNNNNPVLRYLEEPAHHFAPLDALILTHPHIDHYGGAEAITRHFEIQDYYDPGFPGTTGYINFINAFSQPDRTIHNVHRTPGNHGTLNWGNELNAEFLYSWTGDNTGLGSGNTRVNNSSMVLKLTYGTQSFLFMGDAEGKDRANDGGCVSATTDQNERGSKVEPRVYEAPIEEVYLATRSAMESLKWSVKSEDQATHSIQANVPMSMWTWGDKLTVVHTLDESGGVRVNVQSKTGLQIIDYGKNKRNILALYEAIDAVLD